VRSIAREPFSYLITHVPASIGKTFTRAELASQPMLKLLERSGVKVEHATQRIGAGLATPTVAAALRVETGSPLIELVRVVFDRTGRGVEHLHALYRPDRYSIAIDLTRSGSVDRGGWKPAVRVGRRSDRATSIN
jgi:GntR family transcriptional regulator